MGLVSKFKNLCRNKPKELDPQTILSWKKTEVPATYLNDEQDKVIERYTHNASVNGVLASAYNPLNDKYSALTNTNNDITQLLSIFKQSTYTSQKQFKLYRGVNLEQLYTIDTSTSKVQKAEGEVVCGATYFQPTFTSTSKDPRTAIQFACQNSKDNNAVPTLFVIQFEKNKPYHLVSIRNSMFADEEEVLLPPRGRFIVDSVVEVGLDVNEIMTCSGPSSNVTVTYTNAYNVESNSNSEGENSNSNSGSNTGSNSNNKSLKSFKLCFCTFENPATLDLALMNGGSIGSAQKKEYITYQGHRYRVQRHPNDKRRKVIKTKDGYVPISSIKKQTK